MPDFLSKLIDDAQKRIYAGYYIVLETVEHQPISLKSAIKSAKNNAIIAEIKPISPVRGPLRPEIDAEATAIKLERGGATGLSVLTETDNFGGSIESLRKVRRRVSIPLLMKDIVVDKTQIQAAKRYGADCILLIESVFSKHPAMPLDELLQFAHESNLEVLLETHNKHGLDRALKSEADIIGVNNRNLATLEIDLLTTTRLLENLTDRGGKTIISESGIETSADIRKLRHVALDGFLIGSSLMLSDDLEGKIREFVLA